MQNYDLVYVEWEDSVGCRSHWEFLEDLDQPEVMVCKSVGWLLAKKKDCVIVIPHMSTETDKIPFQACGDMTIPMRAIRKIVKIPPDILNKRGMILK